MKTFISHMNSWLGASIAEEALAHQMAKKEYFVEVSPPTPWGLLSGSMCKVGMVAEREAMRGPSVTDVLSSTLAWLCHAECPACPRSEAKSKL